MAPLLIELSGSSTITRLAERANLNVLVSSTGKTQDTVSNDVTSTANTLQSQLQTLSPKTEQGLPTPSAPVTHFTMSGFYTSSHVPKDKDGQDLQRQYTANTTFKIIFRDFNKLGEITSELFRTPHVEIEGTEWKLTDATVESLGAEGRKKALQDAVNKAEDFSDVLGREVVCVEVKDGRGYSRGYASQELGHYGGMGGGSGAGKQQVDGLVLQPEDVKLTASVEAKFRAE